MRNNHRDLSVFVVVCICTIAAASVVPVRAWEYPNGDHDALYESFGPRADSMLIRTYTSELVEWEIGLEGGRIDVADWPLDHGHLVKYTTLPWSNTLGVYGYGAESGAYYLDLNNNNNTFLGNPPNPAYPNPTWPNPMGYTVAESGIIHDNGYPLRHAIAHLVDRDATVSYVGTDASAPIYSPVPPCFGVYSHPDIRPGGARQDLAHLYSSAAASQILNDTGMFPFGADGWRYWDRNRNGVYDGGAEYLELKIVARLDHRPRDYFATLLASELQGSGVKIRVNLLRFTVSMARIQWMVNKDAHIYTAGWSLGQTPDFLELWHWKYYWHPGRPYNAAGCNKDAFNDAADEVENANGQDDAVASARIAQEVFCDAVLGVPVYANTGWKAMSKAYVGTEEQHGESWYGMVNQAGYGIDNTYSFLNMRTSGHEYGGRLVYGLISSDIRQLNPLFTEWIWDNAVLDLVGYESLVARDPYTTAYVPWVAKSFRVETYKHPTLGICTKAVFTLRSDVFFQDGHQLTVEDVYFTLLEVASILNSRNFPPPWWISNAQNVLSFSVLDPLNFEVLLDVKSIFALGWIGENRILPEHIWRPICEGVIAPKTDMPWDPTTFSPDPNLVGSGAWRLDEYAADHILLQANKPGSVVDTGISDTNANSRPITSPYGFFRLKPEYVNVRADDYRAKIDVKFPRRWALVNLTVVDQNLRAEEFEFQFVGAYSDPIGGRLFLRWPMNVGYEWSIIEWLDQTSDGLLGSGDLVKVMLTNPPKPQMIWLNVVAVKPSNILRVGQVLEADRYVYVDGGKLVGPLHVYEKPGSSSVGIFQVNLTKGLHTAKVAEYVTTVWFLCPNSSLSQNPYVGWVNASWPIWITVPEDITGSYYIEPDLLAPDCKVDLKDVFAAGKAFGKIPGDPAWNTVADINHDYKVDLKDYFSIAKMFGKW